MKKEDIFIDKIKSRKARKESHISLSTSEIYQVILYAQNVLFNLDAFPNAFPKIGYNVRIMVDEIEENIRKTKITAMWVLYSNKYGNHNYAIRIKQEESYFTFDIGHHVPLDSANGRLIYAKLEEMYKQKNGKLPKSNNIFQLIDQLAIELDQNLKGMPEDYRRNMTYYLKGKLKLND